ncbi:MAG: peptidoglycan-binding protein [Bacteroidales bacterium]|nr:peptidoglycan-binding protein [Bacteroidales bacterium]
MSAQTIFEQLRKAGMSAAGALGAEGNMAEESGIEACRLQGDFTADRSMSRDYANKVDNGLISEDTFAKDGKGWGLVQFTWSGYKQGLLNHCRRRSLSIADEAAQVDYFVMILKTEFADLWKFLCTTDDIYKATERICCEFERPAVNNVQARYKAALRLRDELQAKATEEIDNGVERYFPPRVLCEGMTGPDVTLLQALLLCHGFNCGGCTGIFNNSTKIKVLSFQAENGLDTDGIAGPKTFKALGVRTT